MARGGARSKSDPVEPSVRSDLQPHSPQKHTKTVHEKRRDHACGCCQDVSFGTAGTLKKHISAVHLKIKRSIKGAQ
jgi:hypothetical protein